jgi:epoxyqueuosine reductase QueG
MAGPGWIGRHNLLVTYEFGSAICMCTILSDVPLKTVLKSPLNSECGNCTICQTVCTVNAIKGSIWKTDTPRDKMVDVYKCTSCLKCLVFCPFTQLYIKNNLGK